MADSLKGWVMVALTLLFVGLYTAALVGWLRPLSDSAMITRLEPIIFVIIGYYFGRLPAQQNEKTLKDEIARQTAKADESQEKKEQAQHERDTATEKMKNAKMALLPDSDRSDADDDQARVQDDSGTESTIGRNGTAHQSIRTAVRILES